MKEHPLDKAERESRERRIAEQRQQRWDELQRRKERGEKPKRTHVAEHRKEK